MEERNEYEINRDVALGADQWLSLNYYNEGKNNIYKAIETLKDKGYRIVATSPHKDGVSPEHFDLQKGKAALMFGTELNGLSEGALELADEYRKLGVKEVHAMIACPPLMAACKYGKSIKKDEDCIAKRMSLEEIRQTRGLDGLYFADVEILEKDRTVAEKFYLTGKNTAEKVAEKLKIPVFGMDAIEQLN